MREAQFAIWDAQAVSNTTIYSDPFELEHFIGFSMHSIWTGTPTGTLTVQVANTLNQPPAGYGDWADLASPSVSLAGSASRSMSNVTDTMYRWARLKYVGSGGTGTLSALIQKKGF